MNSILYLCLQLSLIGFTAACLVQIASALGDGIVLRAVTIAISTGVFLLALPAALASHSLRRRLGLGWFRPIWLSSLWVGVPKIMRTASLGVMAYYVLCMGALLVADWKFHHFIASDASQKRLLCWLGSAAMMGVYSFLATTFYAALYTDDPAHECPNGHPVLPWSKRCGECGVELAKSPPKVSV
jgi:hypothetical protein